MTWELGYLRLLYDVIERGALRPTGAMLPSTGQPVRAHTLFAPAPIRCDLTDGFPAVTTKRLAFRTMAAELLWFLSGSTDVRDLQAMGCRIWDEWAGPNGSVGPSYGHNWRRFGAGWERRGVDQIHQLVCGIFDAAQDPGNRVARRLLLTALDPYTVDETALYPCHPLAQWDVEDGRLSCAVYQRSADLFLGLPFNVASYALLTHLLAAATELRPGTLTMCLGNAHVYENHVDQVREMLRREPMAPPRLVMPEKLYFHAMFSRSSLPSFRVPDRVLPLGLDDLALDGYQHHPALTGEVAV
jgi:thymidylate synthase